MMFDLTGRVALVTGAGRGVGASIAQALAERGAAVAVNDVFAERAESSAQIIAAAGGSSLALPFDVTDLGAVRTAVRHCERELGPVDILVTNAGIPHTGSVSPLPFRDLDPADWSRFIDLNLYGVLNSVHAVIGGMYERRWGRVVAIASVAVHGIAGASVYGAAKGGAVSFMRSLALESAQYGVTANSLTLGHMSNPSRPARPGEQRVAPLGREGAGRDVAAAVVWLAAEGEWVTGQTIGINGGLLTT